tara:strand:- start:188 stop:406 length:219 start_codon:yes stop_codon:yes gene_type:complete
MLKSYVSEETLKVKIDIELGEIQNLIVSLEETETETSPNSYRVKALVTELKKLQRSAVEEAHRSFERMLERQ